MTQPTPWQPLYRVERRPGNIAPYPYRWVVLAVHGHRMCDYSVWSDHASEAEAEREAAHRNYLIRSIR